MTFIADLALYDYYRDAPEALAVGWLDKAQPFITGECARDVRNRLAEYAEHPVRLMRGSHSCQWCWDDAGPPTFADHNPRLIVSHGDVPTGNGEIWVTAPDGTNYAAPTLLTHYIDEHGYLPPEAFIAAVRAGRRTPNLD